MLSGLNAGNQERSDGAPLLLSRQASMLSGLNAGNQARLIAASSTGR